MNTEEAGSLAQVTLRPRKRSSDEATLNLAFRVVIEDALLEHFVNQAVELLPQACRPLLCPQCQGRAKSTGAPSPVRCRTGADRPQDTSAGSGQRHQRAILGLEADGST